MKYSSLDRRQLLKGASVVGLTAAGSTFLSRPALAEPALFAGSCLLTPTQVAGPYYRDLNLVRKDVTEGLPGIPMMLFLRILDVDGCTPLVNAETEIWHTHSFGKYSNFASEGTAGLTWMRGVQFTNANGFATFRTIYPGWYSGRTTHLHLKVYPQAGWELNTQLYFHDPFTAQVYTQADYVARGPKNTSNAADGFFAPELMLTTKAVRDPLTGEFLVAAGHTIVVDRP
jgi:protocatechuate 3,4-dioxygenase beta subunit